MIKKDYQKSTTNVEQVETQDFLLVVSQVKSNEDLQLGGSGDMDDAYSRGSSFSDTIK